jgi:hypothetical protein
MNMAGYDETISEFEFAVVDYNTLTQDFTAELGLTNYDAMLSTKPPNPHGYSFSSGRACFGQRRSAGKGAPDALFGEDYVAGCTSDQAREVAESNTEMNDPPWEDGYHMADGIPYWIEWERELRNLFKEVSRLELDMNRY